MILAFHSIFSMYGFWMPNDPRGSGSDYVAVWELVRYGQRPKFAPVAAWRPSRMTVSNASLA
jgi:hypothetical protein